MTSQVLVSLSASDRKYVLCGGLWTVGELSCSYPTSKSVEQARHSVALLILGVLGRRAVFRLFVASDEANFRGPDRRL